jgi:hypothetical protein
MLNIFRGQRPDVTPAQIAALLVAGIPAIATLLSAFGVADVTQEQQDSLKEVLTWGAILAGVLIGGDATLRTARNVVDAKRDVTAMQVGGAPAPADGGGPDDPEADAAERTVTISDEEEFADEVAALNGQNAIDDPDAVKT